MFACSGQHVSKIGGHLKRITTSGLHEYGCEASITFRHALENPIQRYTIVFDIRG